jgi:thiamine biosynthesis protein ThiI
LTKAIITQCQTYQNHSFTFKVKAKRADKNYPLNSMEIAQRMGGEVLRQFSNFKVDVHQPQIEIIIEIRQSYALFYFNKIKGMGGFPLGINGRVLLLMSGGIDSPVAGYLLMKKGLHVDFLTFISPPHTDERALEKVRQLKNILTLNNKITLAKLFIVNFTKIQHEISHIANHSYQITIMRRYFIKIAMHLADKYHYDAIATGESLGQVASQTVESLTTIQNVVKDKMILRPLLTYDKNEIIALAKSINTYDTSILPYADACSLFVPAHPTTKPKIAVAQVLEDQLELLADIYHNTIAKYIKIE